MSKKLHISNKELVDEFYSDKVFISINSSVDFIELVNQIYLHMGIKFRKNDEEIRIEKSQDNQGLFQQSEELVTHFPYFRAKDGINRRNYILYQNRVSTERLIPNLIKTDYIWMLDKTNEKDLGIINLITSINHLPSVQISDRIDQSNIKNKNRLIL